eukprot:717688_1
MLKVREDTPTPDSRNYLGDPYARGASKSTSSIGIHFNSTLALSKSRTPTVRVSDSSSGAQTRTRKNSLRRNVLQNAMLSKTASHRHTSPSATSSIGTRTGSSGGSPDSSNSAGLQDQTATDVVFNIIDPMSSITLVENKTQSPEFPNMTWSLFQAKDRPISTLNRIIAWSVIPLLQMSIIVIQLVNCKQWRAFTIVVAAMSALFSAVFSLCSMNAFNKYMSTIESKLAERNQVLQQVLRKAKENRNRAQSANKAKSDFLSFLCHELRNPLHAIVMTIHEASRSVKDTNLMKFFLQTINDSSDMMVNIVNDALDMSKIEAGRLQLEHIPFDFREILRKIHRSHKPLCAKRDLVLSLEFLASQSEPQTPRTESYTSGTESKTPSTDPQTPGIDQGSRPFMLIGDPTRLAQIIGNLLSNAIKFTPTGGAIAVTVRAELCCTPVTDGRTPSESPVAASVRQAGESSKVTNNSNYEEWFQISVSVQDTGKGIAPAELQHLFTPFTQAKLDVYRKHGGTGLGLSICRQMALAMHGDIEVTSAVGAGSCFTVRTCHRVVTEEEAEANKACASSEITKEDEIEFKTK